MTGLASLRRFYMVACWFAEATTGALLAHLATTVAKFMSDRRINGKNDLNAENKIPISIQNLHKN